MALIIKEAYRGYMFMFDEIVDQRTKSWPLVAKPYQGIALIVLYIMFVLRWGPKWMKHRQPFNIDKLLIVYNAAQILICLYIFIQAIMYAWGWKYKWICEPVNFANTPEAIYIARITYWYYLTKVVDLLDTVFFVLRKKFSQITFLHLYHHTGMVLLVWASVSYLPGGHGSLIGVINSFVHVVMYGYYLMSVGIPAVKNVMWIKKFVTQLQIMQFFWCAVHMLIIVFKTDCEYPRWPAAVFLPQNLFMLVLFVDFYIKAYIKKPKQKQSVHKSMAQNRNSLNSHIINQDIKTTNCLTNENDINHNNLNNNKSNNDKCDITFKKKL